MKYNLFCKKTKDNLNILFSRQKKKPGPGNILNYNFVHDGGMRV